MDQDPGDDQTARQRRLWERMAPGYDSSMRCFERVWFAGGRAWIGARAAGRVLEVGVGTGASLPHYRSTIAIVGVDLSPAMLSIARTRAAGLGRSVELIEGDAQQLPLPDAAFDTVVCALALCSIPHPEAAIREMHRVLVPGGRLLLLDHVGSTWPSLRIVQRLAEQITVRAAGEHLTRRQLPLVQAAGFIIEEAGRRSAGTVERIHARKPV